MPTTHLPGCLPIDRSVADRDGLDLSEIRHPRTCPYCDGNGKGPDYGHEHGDRLWCDSCGGSGYEPVDPDLSTPWIGPRLTGTVEQRVALLLQYAAAAVLARRVTLPALRIAGMALCGAVAAGPRKTVIDTTATEAA